MRIILTGATGFIGRRLGHALSEIPNVELYCVARGSFPVGNVVQADLSRRGWTKALPSKADVVFHLAQSIRYRDFPQAADDIMAVNVDASAEMASWARVAGVRQFLFTSTGNVYGQAARPVAESAPTDARTMYAASKLSAELLLRPYSGWFQVVVARLFGVYGPGQRTALFPNIIGRIRKGEEITLAQGIGVRLNPIYVDECVDLLTRLTAAEHASDYEVYNVGGPDTVDLSTVVRLVEEITGCAARIRITQDIPTMLTGDISKITGLLTGVRWTQLREGLQRTIRA